MANALLPAVMATRSHSANAQSNEQSNERSNGHGFCTHIPGCDSGGVEELSAGGHNLSVQQENQTRTVVHTHGTPRTDAICW